MTDVGPTLSDPAAETAARSGDAIAWRVYDPFYLSLIVIYLLVDLTCLLVFSLLFGPEESRAVLDTLLWILAGTPVLAVTSMISQARRPKPALFVNADGFHFPEVYRRPVPWSSVRQLRLDLRSFGMSGGIRLVVEAAHCFDRRPNFFHRLFPEQRNLRKDDDLFLPVVDMQVDPRTLFARMEALRAQAAAQD